MCGVTTGGRDDCFWDCEINGFAGGNGAFITNPECLEDCFEQVGYIKMMFVTLISDIIFHLSGQLFVQPDPGFYCKWCL